MQELFSDTGVGRQQHVIVGQGQIDAVLNARPEERRLIIEEAAGVLKHRKRKERSERRLAATEGNLTRLGDLLREVRRQLRPLERQADAARRHGDLVAELRALQIFVAGRELSTLKRRLGERPRPGPSCATRRPCSPRRLAELDAVGHGGRGRAGHARRRRGRRRPGPGPGAAREGPGPAGAAGRAPPGRRPRAAASVDQGVVASLEADAARLPADLAALAAESEALAPDAEALAEAEAALADARAAFEAEWGEGVPAPSGRASEVRGELGALRKVLDRAGADAERAGQRGRPAAGQARAPRRRGGRGRPRRSRRRPTRPRWSRPSRRPRAPRGRRGRRPGGRAAAGRRPGRAPHLERPADALGLALDEARARAGAERLAGVDGVVGTLLDLVDVDPGWEAAAEAACGEALAAVVVDSVDSGRRALRSWRRATCPARCWPWAWPRPAPAAAAGGRAGAAPRAPRRPEVGPLLDGLLGAAVAVDGGWPRRSTPPWPTPTPWSSPARAAASAGGLARVHRDHRRHRRRPRRGPGAAAAATAAARPLGADHGRPGRRWPRPARPRRRPPGRSTSTARPWPRPPRPRPGGADRDDAARRAGPAAEQQGEGRRAPRPRRGPGRRAGGRAARARGRGGRRAAAGRGHGGGPAAARRAGQRGRRPAHRPRQAPHRPRRPQHLPPAPAGRGRGAAGRLGGGPAPGRGAPRRARRHRAGPRPAGGVRQDRLVGPRGRLVDLQERRQRRPRPSGRCRPGSTACGASAPRREGRWPRGGSGPSAPSSTRPRSGCGWSRPSSCAAPSSTSSPRPRSRPCRRSWPRA